MKAPAFHFLVTHFPVTLFLWAKFLGAIAKRNRISIGMGLFVSGKLVYRKMIDKKMKATTFHFLVTHFPVTLFLWAKFLGAIAKRNRISIGMGLFVSGKLVYRKMIDKKMKATAYHFLVAHFPVYLFLCPNFCTRSHSTITAQSAWGCSSQGSLFTGK